MYALDTCISWSPFSDCTDLHIPIMCALDIPWSASPDCTALWLPHPIMCALDIPWSAFPDCAALRLPHKAGHPQHEAGQEEVVCPQRLRTALLSKQGSVLWAAAQSHKT